MTIVEKAAYLKGLTEGLGMDADSKEGKLWNALNELLRDMAHEIEDLHACNMDHAEALDEIAEEREDIKVCKVDIDQQPELASQYRIMSVPTLMVLKDGHVVEQSLGAKPKHQILAML